MTSKRSGTRKSKSSARWTDTERGRLWDLRSQYMELNWVQFHRMNFFPGRSRDGLYHEYSRLAKEKRQKRMSNNRQTTKRTGTRPQLTQERPPKQARLGRDNQAGNESDCTNDDDGDIDYQGVPNPASPHKPRVETNGPEKRPSRLVMLNVPSGRETSGLPDKQPENNTSPALNLAPTTTGSARGSVVSLSPTRSSQIPLLPGGNQPSREGSNNNGYVLPPTSMGGSEDHTPQPRRVSVDQNRNSEPSRRSTTSPAMAQVDSDLPAPCQHPHSARPGQEIVGPARVNTSLTAPETQKPLPQKTAGLDIRALSYKYAATASKASQELTNIQANAFTSLHGQIESLRAAQNNWKEQFQRQDEEIKTLKRQMEEFRKGIRDFGTSV